jgi:hypothetical protein
VKARDALARVVALLDAAGIPYMISGSIAGTYYGTPRTTMDFDIVIEPSARSLDALLRSLDPEEHYADRDAALRALRSRGQFNVFDVNTGWKADLIVRKDRPFSREEFRRRRRATVLGLEVFLSSPEDTVLSKLEWARKGGSERQLRDVEGIVSVRGRELDVGHLDRWAPALGVEREWRRIRRRLRRAPEEEEGQPLALPRPSAPARAGWRLSLEEQARVV